jgi:ubiquitin fusion degradation protein 1
MNFLNNFMFGGQGNRPNANQEPTRNPGRNAGGPTRGPNVHPSTRGGLPQILDMLRVYPSYFVERPDLENGNKVLLPPRILEQITSDGNIPHPMVFSISTLRTQKTVYVGVLEFMAPDDAVVMPFWLFNELHLNEGEMVRLGLVDFLPKATFAKIRPHKTEFIDLPDPRAILEIHLRDFVCFTKNETIAINFMGKQYMLDVLELKPENQYNAAILIDTDLNIEFEAPLDYVEPVRQTNQGKKETGPAKPQGMRIDSKPLKEHQITGTVEPEYDPRLHKIPHGIRNDWYKTSFTGQGFKVGK